MRTFANYWNYITTTFRYRKLFLIQAVIIAGVLLLSGGIAYKATETQAAIVLALVAGIIGIMILLQWPAITLFLILLTGFFVKPELENGLNVTVGMVASLVALWFAKMFVVERQIRFFPSRTNIPIFVFIILSLISYGIGMLPLVPFSAPAELTAQTGGMAIFILSALTFLAVANLIDGIWLERFTWTFIAIGVSYIIARIVVANGIHIGKPFSPGATTESMFLTWLAAMMFSQAWFNKRIHPAIRILLGIGIVAMFYVVYGYDSDWKSGWVPPLVTIVAIVAIRYWKVSLLIAPLGVVAAVLFALQLINTDTYSWSTRLDAWKIVIEIAKTSPVFGLGFANYYWYAIYFPIRGWYVPFNSHSQYVDIIAQTGVLGLLSFLWIFWEVGRVGWYLRARTTGFFHAYTYGVLGGIAGTLVAAALADWVLPFAYNIGLSGFRTSILAWIFMGGIVVVERQTHAKSNDETLKTLMEYTL